MPIVVGVLGMIPKGLVGNIESIRVNLSVAQIQKIFNRSEFSSTEVA